MPSQPFFERRLAPLICALVIGLAGYVGLVYFLLAPFRHDLIDLDEVMEFAAAPPRGEEGVAMDDPMAVIERLDYRPLREWEAGERDSAATVYWFRLQLDRLEPTRRILRGAIEMNQGGRVGAIESVRLFERSSEGWQLVSEAGASRRVARSFDTVFGRVSLPLNFRLPGEEASTYYLRLSVLSELGPSFRMWPDAARRRQLESRLEILSLLNMGMLLALLVVVAVFALSQRSWLMAAYAGYVALDLLILLNSWQARTGTWVFWRLDTFQSYGWIALLASTASYFFLIRFTRAFFRIGRGTWGHRLVVAADLANLGSFVLIGLFGWQSDASTAIGILILREAALLVLLGGIGWQQFRGGHALAHLFLLSFFVLFAFSIVGLLILLGWIPGWQFPFSELSFPDLAAVISPMILVVAGTEAFRLLQFQRDRAQADALHNLDRLHQLEVEARAGLEQKVAVRTRELALEVERSHNAESALEQALQEVQQASQAKSNFFAGMSHELRTPLNAILGYAQLATKPDYGEAKRLRAFELIEQSGRHLLELINDILSLSKADAGKIQTHVEAFDLAGLLRELTDLIGISAQQKGIALTLAIDPEVPRSVRGDPRLLRQILINLLGNAIKFTDQGQVSLQVDLEPRSGLIRLAVRDTGVGIAADELESIFDPFAQSKRPVSDRPGTGLGLAISRRLAEVLGGSLTVTSGLGEGSTFTVALPLPAGPARAVTTPEAEAEVETVAAIAGAELRWPAAEVLAALRRDAAAGHVGGVRAGLARLAERAGDTAVFRARVTRLLGEFDLEGIVRLIDEAPTEEGADS